MSKKINVILFCVVALLFSCARQEQNANQQETQSIAETPILSADFLIGKTFSGEWSLSHTPADSAGNNLPWNY